MHYGHSLKLLGLNPLSSPPWPTLRQAIGWAADAPPRGLGEGGRPGWVPEGLLKPARIILRKSWAVQPGCNCRWKA